MISADLFPNASSFYVGQTANQYTCYLSGDLYNLTIPDVSVFDGYYLGWCTPETLPSGVLQTSYYIDTTNNKLKFFQSTPDENFKIGYGQRGASAVGNVSRVRTVINDGASPVTQFYNVQYNYLYNNLYPEYVSGMHSVILTFVYYSPYFDGSSEIGGTFQKSFGTEYTYADFYSFIYDDMPLSATFRINNIDHTITFKYSDLKDKFFESFIADTGREFIVYSSGINWRGREIYNGSYSYDDSIYESLVIYNSCVNEYDSDTAHTFDGKNVIITNIIGGQFAFWNGNARTLSLSTDFVSAQPPTCDIDFTELGSSGDYVIFRQNEYGNGGVAFVRTGALERNIYFVAPLKYFINAVMLMWRTQINQTYSYQLGGSWATDVNENDQFLGEWKTGNIANTTFKNGLRPWQYGNIQDNEFAPDDAPPYTPPSPEPDEDEESGDRIPNQYRSFSGSNNFISQYALTAEQLQTFGQMLWTSWNDSQTVVDAINNFWIAWNIEDFTGSFDVSSVMDFIVSLRVFPFNPVVSGLSNFVLTDKLNIGRGTFPFLFPSQVGNIVKLLSTVIYVDCGTVTIPRRFGDFKDYNNMNITCFCPYCGTVELNAGDVIGRTLHARYAVDMQTGDCLCMITMEYNGSELYNVASIAGNMGANIPVSATNSGLIMARRISDEANGIGLFGGMFTENFSMGARQFANPYRQQSAIGAIAGAASTAMGNVFKDIQQAGQFATDMLSRGAISCPIMQGGDGFTSFAQADTPFIQMRYGIYAEPANFSHSVGRISTSSGTIGSYKGSGFITCENVDTTKLTCHNDEKAAIAAALETGVFV